MIDIKQFTGKTITPKDDALLYDFLIDQSGVFEGCEVTHLGTNQLKIAAGRGMIKGRIFVVEEETILATVSDSGTKLGRLIIQVDVSNTETPISFVTQMAASLPSLTQEDINRDGSVYELPLATYNISEILISSLVSVAPTVFGNSVLFSSAKTIVSDLVSTTKTLATLADNTEYKLGTLTALTVSAYPTTFECLISFTGGVGVTVTLPTTKLNGGSAPTWTAGKVYEISIKDGRAAAGEF